MKLKFTFILPVCYLVGALFCILILGGAGHGKGIEYFFYISLPFSFFVGNTAQPVLYAMVIGVFQYTLIGWLIDFRKK